MDDAEPPTPASDDEQFVTLLTSHHERLLGFVKTLIPNRADAEDVFQRGTVSLWQKHGEYDPKRPFFPWACRFLHFEVLNYRKRMARDRLCFSEDILEKLAEEQVEQQPLLDARREALDLCIDKLSPHEQTILNRRYGEKGSISSLAEDLGVTSKQLYKTLERIRRNLSLCLDRTTAAS
ncbi:MAG: sigma-70 family RNA polymerase sigma factor [Verrucomicrobiota bacterium]